MNKTPVRPYKADLIKAFWAESNILTKSLAIVKTHVLYF